MKRCLKTILSLTLVLALAGSVSSTAQAHSGRHSRRAKGTRAAAFMLNRGQTLDTADSTAANNTAAAGDTAAAIPAAPAGDTAAAVPAAPEAAPAPA